MNMPDFNKSFEYENNFHLTCGIQRIAKILVHYELYSRIIEVPGAVVECGVFKGVSLTGFATFRNLLSSPFSKKIIGFDTFKEYPETNFEADKLERERFIREAGCHSISKKQLENVLEYKKINESIELVEGNIVETVPTYVKAHPELKISLINLDVDIYEPSVVVLEYFYPKLERGGILLLDDYGFFPGSTKAVDEYFKNRNIRIQKIPFCKKPCFIIKE